MPQSSVYLPIEELERECRLETLRRSGPGGQNRNKVETGARYYHLPTGLVGEATEERYQGVNRRNALERLRLAIALTVRTPIKLTEEDGAPALSKESAAAMRWFARLTGDKLRVAKSNFDYPILVSEFFDTYLAADENLTVAAALLHTTSSQIVRFLAQEPKALEALNVMRAKRGLTRLTR